MSKELLATARRLATASRGKPRQSDLKRAISTAYYALFHAIAKAGADLLVGTADGRYDSAWTQVYRALDHGAAKAACGQLRNLKFSAGLIECGDEFIKLQEDRHKADYSPYMADYQVTRTDAINAIDQAERAIDCLHASDRHERRAFVARVLLKRR